MRPLRSGSGRNPIMGHVGVRARQPARRGGGSPMTTDRDAEIQAFTIGEVKLHNGPVVLVDYDPRWPGLFAREDARIRGILGARVRLLEHTGSTSVPGLAAKPVIDMTMAVPDSSDE